MVFMALKKTTMLSISIMSILIVSLTIPAYAEVLSVKIDKIFYEKGDQITFSGTVLEEDSGLVTLVIRDPQDQFVMLTQAQIQADNTYERTIIINDKFGVHGIHKTIAFIQNLTAGSSTNFEFSVDGSPVIPSLSTQQTLPKETVPTIPPPPVVVESPTPVKTSTIANFVDPAKDPQYYIDRYDNEVAYKTWFDSNYPNLTIEEAVGITKEPVLEVTKTSIPGFPDPTKDPQHYIDRYNNEPAYKEWFDRNFPNQSIYDVVGISDPQEIQVPLPTAAAEVSLISTQESVPVSIEASTVSYSSEFTQMLLALGGLAVLFGAVYGIKRKVDNNSEQIIENKKEIQVQVNHNIEQISQNRFWLKNKLMNLKKSTDPIKIIQERLAKGEISVDEYYQLVSALDKQ